MKYLSFLFIFVVVLPVLVQCSEEPSSSYKFKAGTYTGEGDGFGGLIVMQVVVDNARILSISTINHNETRIFSELPFERIPKAIIDTQSLAVDTITGATRTSNGIITAVANALRTAGATDDQLFPSADQ
jgi:fumarate reductase flavoprotein subunit